MNDPADFWKLPEIKGLIGTISSFFGRNPGCDDDDVRQYYLQKKVDVYLELFSDKIGGGGGTTIRALFIVCIQGQVALSQKLSHASQQSATLDPHPVSPRESQPTVQEANEVTQKKNNENATLADQNQPKPNESLPLKQTHIQQEDRAEGSGNRADNPSIPGGNEQLNKPSRSEEHADRCQEETSTAPLKNQVRLQKDLTRPRGDKHEKLQSHNGNKSTSNEQHQENLKKHFQQKYSGTIFDLLLHHGSLSRCQLAGLLGVIHDSTPFRRSLKELKQGPDLVEEDPTRNQQNRKQIRLSDRAFVSPNDRPEPNKLDARVLEKAVTDGSRKARRKKSKVTSKQSESHNQRSGQNTNQGDGQHTEPSNNAKHADSRPREVNEPLHVSQAKPGKHEHAQHQKDGQATSSMKTSIRASANQQHQERLTNDFQQKYSVAIFDLLLKHGSISRRSLAGLLGTKEGTHSFSYSIQEVKLLKALVEDDPSSDAGKKLLRLSDKAFLNPNDRPTPIELDPEVLAKAYEDGYTLRTISKKRKKTTSKKQEEPAEAASKKALKRAKKSDIARELVELNNEQDNATQRRTSVIVRSVTDPSDLFIRNRMDMSDVMLHVQIGSRVEVFWAGDDCYYPGTIKDVRENVIKAKKPFLLVYDDGDSEWIDLTDHVFRLIENEDAAAIDNEDVENRNNKDETTAESEGGAIPDSVESLGSRDGAGNLGKSLGFWLPGVDQEVFQSRDVDD